MRKFEVSPSMWDYYSISWCTLFGLPILVGILFFLLEINNGSVVIDQRFLLNLQYNQTKVPKKSLFLCYVWGSYVAENQLAVWVRSLRETSDPLLTDVIIFAEMSVNFSVLARETLSLGRVEVRYVNSKLKRHSVINRYFVWRNCLENFETSTYGHVALCDMDMLFQRNLVQNCFGYDFAGIAAFAENPATKIGECGIHSKWYKNCNFTTVNNELVDGEQLFKKHSSFDRLCNGFVYGDFVSIIKYLSHATLALKNEGCNDQGVHNMLIWGNFISDMKVHFYDQSHGLVKHADVGFVMDAWGYAYNEDGVKYCLVHQFSGQRNDDYVEFIEFGRYAYSKMWSNGQNPSGLTSPRGRRVHMQDLRYRGHVHPITYKMHLRNLTFAGLLAANATVPSLSKYVPGS